MKTHKLIVKLVLGGLGGLVSMGAQAHSLSGCLSGQGFLTLPPFARQPCARIVLRHDFSESAFSMRVLALDCPNFGRSWEEKIFEIRNGRDIWGGVREKQLVGTLSEEGYWFVDPVNALQFIEYKAERDPQTGRVTWLESFAHNTQKIYWKIEADLAPVACEDVENIEEKW